MSHRRRIPIGVLTALAALPACGRSPSTESILPEAPKTSTIRLESPAFADGGAIPEEYTCDGRDVSPPLKWAGVPEAAKSLTLVVEDPDAPRGTWTHWFLFGIPADISELPKGGADKGASRTGLGREGRPPREERLRQGRVRRPVPPEREAPLRLPALRPGRRTRPGAGDDP